MCFKKVLCGYNLKVSRAGTVTKKMNNCLAFASHKLNSNY